MEVCVCGVRGVCEGCEGCEGVWRGVVTITT